MTIETAIDSLVSYAMNCGLTQPEDHIVVVNRLLEALQLDSYTPSEELLSEDLEEILAAILQYACEKGICEDNITARDLFDTKLMGLLTPMLSVVTPIISAATVSPRICAGSTKAPTGKWISPST